ncbi:MAG: hypothetical protein FWC71_03415 [Defluviitaleaceae bacterium]|nr:hypothetical protein [Defluviitaleaceae bacterium]
MFALKPDYEQAKRRIETFWHHEDTDRPFARIVYPKANAKPITQKHHATKEDWWLDVEYRAEADAQYMENFVYFADALPLLSPNLGPGILSAWAGCPYTFGLETAWTDPCVTDWEKDKAIMDMNHPLAKKLEKYTALLLERGKGKFIVGLSDFHPGGDHLAALRGNEALAMDMYDNPDAIKAWLESSYAEYFPIYDYYVDWLRREGQPIASWLHLVDDEKMYIPSNDFSCMVSKDMFDEFFLPGIIRECKHYGKSIYHLDGPGALQHLDSLLAIPELHAIQWVPGAGQDELYRWVDVCKKILNAKKSLYLDVFRKHDLDVVMENLPAKGLALNICNIRNEEDANDVLKRISSWPR